jgi:hypothetical protein
MSLASSTFRIPLASCDRSRTKWEALHRVAVSNPSDNLKNLFEIPVLFYALALYLFITNQVDVAYVTAA